MATENPLITVVIPTYNRIQTLPRAIESVKKQTYSNWELLIIDDGSSDRTKELIQRKYIDESNIFFVERESSRPKGANACRNIGAEKGNGQYLAFLDSDDEWLPIHLEHKLKLLIDSDADFIFGAFLINQKNRLIKNQCFAKDNPLDIESYLATKQAGIRTSTFLIKRSSFLSIKFDENLGKHQDWDFALRYCRSRDFVVNHKPTVKIHISHNRMSGCRNHEATSRFINKHVNKIKRSTYKRFLTNVGLNTFIEEGNNSALRNYTHRLRKLGDLGSFRYLFVAYVITIPILGRIIRPLVKVYKSLLR